MFKKLASIALAASMVIGGAAITASAAEAEDAVAAADDSSAVAADDGSSAVAADDGSSAVAADSTSESTGASQVINFDVKSTGWGSNVKTVYCHIYAYTADDYKYTAWQTKAEKCKYDSSTGIATYDLATGIKKGATGLEHITADNKWVVMFSCNTNAETYTLLFNSTCYGDTVIADPSTEYENNVDSEKKSIKISYKNSNLTAPKCITSTGKIQGESFAYGENNSTLFGAYMHDYYNDSAKFTEENLKNLMNQLGDVDANETLKYIKDRCAREVKAGTIDQATSDAIIKACTDMLEKLTGSKPDASKASGGSNSSNSNGGSNSGSGSSSNGGSGSSSVSSGEETTILFVFGGLMIAAAGVMFLARKKRQF